MIKNEDVTILSDGRDMGKVLDAADHFSEDMQLKARESKRIRLLAEETMCMVREITGNPEMKISFMGNADSCAIHVETDTRVNIYVRNKLMELSKNGKNDAAKGLMGKIIDVMEHFICMTSPDLSSLPADPTDPVYSMGMTQYDHSAGADMNMRGMAYWSLQQYRNNLQKDNAASEKSDKQISAAWDELEKSVVANLADDVRVGIKSNNVYVDVILKIKKEEA